MAVYSYEDIAAKAEWEGGLDEALDWFKPEEVPADIRSYWFMAQQHKNCMEQFLSLIEEKMEERSDVEAE